MRSRNSIIMGLNEYAQASWFTRQNQDLASVMVLGTGKFKIALNIDSERDTPDEVICNPPYKTGFWGCPRGLMVKAMNYGIVVREFVLQSRYYVHFRANTLGKGMNPLILPPAMGK